jgi:P27 family predicted phage terminase small subunit
MAINKKKVSAFVSRNGITWTGAKETIDALIHQGTKLTNELKKANRYEDTDDVLIESLVMCVEVRNMAFWDIKEHGTIMFIDKEQTVKQKNHSVSTFMQMNKSILDISQKLGLSARDRHDLKLEAKKLDELDD